MTKNTLKNRLEKEMIANLDKSKKDPGYPVEDVGCSCNDEGFKSEWIWVDTAPCCYICRGCGEMQ